MEELEKANWLQSGKTGPMSARVPRRLLGAFHEKIREDGLLATDAVRALVLAYVLGHVKISSAVPSGTPDTEPQPLRRSK